MAQEPRAKRTTKKPAWLIDNVDPSQLVTGEAKAPRQQHKKSSHERPAGLQQDERWQSRTALPRMCLNPGCKNPFESPQWRRGPAGPGTLCNACGTRYARIEAKKRGERKGGAKLRTQDVADWQAFEQLLHQPLSAREAWQAYADHHRARGAAAIAAAASAAAAAAVGEGRAGHQQLHQLLQQQQQYDDEYEDTFEDDGVEGQYQQSEHEQAQEQQQQQQQQGVFEDNDELLCKEGMPDSDSPGDKATAVVACRAALAAAAAARTPAAGAPAAAALVLAAAAHAAPVAAAGSSLLWAGLHGLPQHIPQQQQQQQPPEAVSLTLGSGSPEERHSPYPEFGPHRPSRRRPRRCDDEAGGSDSQEAAACSYQEPHGCISSSTAGRPAEVWGCRPAGEQFLHLLAVGEAMIKTEGVAQEDRQEAWSEYVAKQLPAEQRREADSIQGLKRSRFGLEAGENLAGRSGCAPAAAHQEVANDAQSQRQAPQPLRHMPEVAEHAVPLDRFERLLAEAEQCIRARSASPCMRRAQAASPLRRPVTPLAGGLGTAALPGDSSHASTAAAAPAAVAPAAAGVSACGSLAGHSAPAAVGCAAEPTTAAPAGSASGHASDAEEAGASDSGAVSSVEGSAADKAAMPQQQMRQAEASCQPACPALLPSAAAASMTGALEGTP